MPQVRTPNNMNVGLAPSAQRKLAMMTPGGGAKELAAEIYTTLLIPDVRDFGMVVEEILAAMAQKGFQVPEQALSALDGEAADAYKAWSRMFHAEDALASFAAAKKLAGLIMAHATIMRTWAYEMDKGNEQWQMSE